VKNLILDTNKVKTRLDKWLWAARFYRTRSLSSHAINSGKVLLNEKKPKPSKMVTENDKIKIRKHKSSVTIKILEISQKRRSPQSTKCLYLITHRTILNQKHNLQGIPSPHGPRPTKKDRRSLDSLTKKIIG